MTETPRSKMKLVLIALIVGVIAVPISFLVLYGLGQTSGVEFSPDDFSRRSFSYNQTPWLNWVVEKKTYRDSTTLLEKNLVLDGLIVPIINNTKNWDLISESGSGSVILSASCDARFLTDFLDLTDEEGDNFWVPWNEKYPKSATVFWPRIAKMARDEMYLVLPALMQLAMEIDSDDDKQFSKALDQLIASAYYELGKLDFEMQRFNRAMIRLQYSVNVVPSPESIELLAKTQSAVHSNGLLAEAPE